MAKSAKKNLNPPTPSTHGHGDSKPLTDISPAEARTTKRDIESHPRGRFGRLFPDLPPSDLPRETLIALGQSMVEHEGQEDDSEVPAGYTYFGQFVDHDLSFDSQGPLSAPTGPNEQQRSPELELDSLYGKGPRNPESRDMYVGPPTEARFKIGNTSPLPFAPADRAFPNDLPRDANRKAIIGDPRNDENLIVAQTHLLFLKFHNKILDILPTIRPEQDLARPNESPFGRARRLVTWHYQWIVWHDFVKRFAWAGVTRSIEQVGPMFYRLRSDERPYMPFEFSVAAYRMGHSMIRDDYRYNRFFPDATLEQLFQFTGTGGLAGLPTLPSNWIINWSHFYKLGGGKLNKAHKFDTKLEDPLFHLHPTPGIPGEDVPNPALHALAVRNLLRSKQVGLPSGQRVAQEMGAVILQPDQVGTPNAQVNANTPLWYYILREAEVYGNGGVDFGPLPPDKGGFTLGPVGSRIVAEVFWGLLHNDSSSYLRQQPMWRPIFPAETPGTFTMADLVRFVNDINPLGDNSGPDDDND